ncbi:hypothetical protein SBA3_320026 [Candidatus Sulfopaludibacter sp. SbA3]|nr:hypothetical protein SBA3_320026 [Candidatus Sulfopaludibacter sp. SbA3]
MVKGPRVAGARTLEEANHYLEDLEEEFLPWWNQHLVTAPANATDAHRPLGPNTTRQLRSAKWRPIRSTTTTAFQWTGCQEGSIESRSVRDYEEARYAWSDDSMAAWLFAFAGAIWSIHLAKRFRSKTAPKTSAPHPQKVEALASVPSVHEQTAGQATPACMESQPACLYGKPARSIARAPPANWKIKTQEGTPGKSGPAIFALYSSEDRCSWASPKQICH